MHFRKQRIRLNVIQYSACLHNFLCLSVLWMIMVAKWYSGALGAYSFLTFALQERKNPEETSPKKLVSTGDRTLARCVTSAHATTSPTAVDRNLLNLQPNKINIYMYIYIYIYIVSGNLLNPFLRN